MEADGIGFDTQPDGGPAVKAAVRHFHSLAFRCLFTAFP